MRIGFMAAAIFALGSGALAEDHGRSTAILVSPIHEAQIVRGDDGKDHVEYELLVVNVFSEPVTLSSVTVPIPPERNSSGSNGALLRLRPRPCSRRRRRPSCPHRPPSPLTSI
jgi:hypothetical protein